MSYTETELNEALNQAEAANDQGLADFIRKKMVAMKGCEGSKMPNLQAYVARCLARCRPKGYEGKY